MVSGLQGTRVIRPPGDPRPRPLLRVAQDTAGGDGAPTPALLPPRTTRRSRGLFPQYLPVSRGGDEVQAAVDSVVGHLASVHPGLGVEVILELAVDVVDDRLPAEGGETGAHDWVQRSASAQGFQGDNMGSNYKPGPIGSPVAVVHGVTEPWRVHDVEQEMDSSLLDQHLGLLHLGQHTWSEGHLSWIRVEDAFMQSNIMEAEQKSKGVHDSEVVAGTL